MTAIEVPLTQGLVTLIDEEDHERVLAAGRWIVARGDRTFYARKSVHGANGVRANLLLHTFLTGWPLVDHRNGNGLDNRRANLREATPAENSWNRRVRADSASGFKGVRWHTIGRKWQAQIQSDGTRKHLGLFGTPEAAAHAYDEAARELHGEFAATNFPLVGERGAR